MKNIHQWTVRNFYPSW